MHPIASSTDIIHDRGFALLGIPSEVPVGKKNIPAEFNPLPEERISALEDSDIGTGGVLQKSGRDAQTGW